MKDQIIDYLREPRTIREIQTSFGKQNMEKIIQIMKSCIISGKITGTNDGRYISCP